VQPTNSTVEDWQAMLDRDFPHGAIVSYAGDDDAYTTPYFEVLGMEDGQPQVFWMVYTNSDKGFGPLTITKYEPFQTSPHLLVRVEFINMTAMVWCAKLSPEMTIRMDIIRKQLGVTS
jgi:hypothetical protein